MTKYQEILNLTMLEADIIMFGKIEKRNDNEPFPCKRDNKRLKKYRFDELQDKYKYGWYIAETDLDVQIRDIEIFKQYIMENYEED